MRNWRLDLPPLNTLVAFEASARLSSFTKAASELGVSREAVSRQIRLLEEHHGVKLFRRLYRAIELTEEGQVLLVATREALRGIAAASKELRGGGPTQRVWVTATIAIASYWLTPRLPEFRRRHPGIEIRVLVSDQPHNMASEGIDLGLRYGDGRWPGLTARKLFETATFPVCSPGYLEREGPIEGADDLLTHTLLNLDGAPHVDEDWRWWFQEAGVESGATLELLGFDNYSNVMQAALDGQGVALGFGGIIDGLMEKGGLLRPVPTVLRKGLAVHLVRPARSRLSAPAQKLHDWIVEEAEKV